MCDWTLQLTNELISAVTYSLKSFIMAILSLPPQSFVLRSNDCYRYITYVMVQKVEQITFNSSVISTAKEEHSL